jgi:2-dehydropantoate 2-reductase
MTEGPSHVHAQPLNDAVIAIVGAGAIGGLLTAELLAAGREVTLCARHPLDRIVVERAERPREVHPPVVTAPERLAPADWVLVALKGQDSAGAAPWLRAAAGPETVVVAVQNGVEHRENVGPYVDGAAFLPALIYAAVERVERGRLVHRTGDHLVLPAEPAAERLAALFEGSALHVELERDFRTAAWRKLLTNVAANPITALTMGRSEVLELPSVRALALGLLRECADVGRAEGARLAPDEPERTLAYYDGLPRDGGSSMLYDRLAGRPLEYETLTGAVVRAAKRHGLDVPLNRAILALLEGLDRYGSSTAG